MVREVHFNVGPWSSRLRDLSSFALVVSYDNGATQQKLGVSGADLKVGVDTHRRRSMLVDVSLYQVAEGGGG